MKDEILNFKSTGDISRAAFDRLSLRDHERPLTLIIAGIDSGGGAGLTADCLSVQDNGAYPLVCPTALTVQSLKRVGTVQAVDPQLFAETLDVLIEDFPGIAAVKVGLVTSQALLELILKYLEGPLSCAKVVWDPVLTATAGNFESADLKAALPKILARSTVITPNLNEALALMDWDTEMLKDKGVRALGEEFLKLGAQAVLIKGGHGDDPEVSADVLVKRDLVSSFGVRRMRGQGVHGGGCALSSALAANLACGYAVEDATLLAKTYVTAGIRNPAIDPGNGRPPCGHHHDFLCLENVPTVLEEGFPAPSALNSPECGFNLGLYPVLPSSDWIERVLRLGIRTVQLRIKDASRPDLKDEIRKAVALCERYGARLFIDDHYEEAIAAGAYGVHLGMEDLQKADLDRIKRAGLRLGVSTHGPYETVKALQLKPSYIALGHVFPTNTKAMVSKPQGVWSLEREVKLLRHLIPTVAIGGVKLSNAQAVMDTGVDCIAVVTALTDCGNDQELSQAVRAWTAYTRIADPL